MLPEIKQQIAKVIAQTFDDITDLGRFEVGYAADARFGDVATNAAMVYAKDMKRPPREVAGELADALRGSKGFEKVEVAGPGFINITLSDARIGELAIAAPTSKPAIYAGQEVVVEYSDPNPFKVLHVGHLYTSVVGDAISRLVQAAGGNVHDVNFGGDVGLHVGRTLWAILRELGGEQPEGLANIAEADRSEWMTRCYIEGTRAYEDDEVAKAEIIALNKRVYEIHARNDHESNLAKIYWTCRQWSYDHFDAFYARIGTRFEKYYPESETTQLGLDTVREQLKRGVYEESDGAVVFRGEPYGLHTRVFINSNGLPTYEAKDVGLILTKWQDYRFDRSIVITGNDILEYMKVVLKSIEQFNPELVAKSTHITHGNVKLAGGVKMSSRKGNILRAGDVLDLVAQANKQATGSADEKVVLGAVKYAFLKHRIGSDIVFVPEESVSLDGNSGPYLQYAHARARSVMAKTDDKPAAKLDELGVGERVLARKLIEYPDVISKAVSDLMPHHVATYLYELAQAFNRFYEHNRVIGDERQAVRLRLVGVYADVLKDGLELLGVAAPDRL
ncbi:MAG: argS [Patescibacteria group bacterium]|nr:argS [Patescibacteria group bacterium]